MDAWRPSFFGWFVEVLPGVVGIASCLVLANLHELLFGSIDGLL